MFNLLTTTTSAAKTPLRKRSLSCAKLSSYNKRIKIYRKYSSKFILKILKEFLFLNDNAKIANQWMLNVKRKLWKTFRWIMPEIGMMGFQATLGSKTKSSILEKYIRKKKTIKQNCTRPESFHVFKVLKVFPLFLRLLLKT